MHKKFSFWLILAYSTYSIIYPYSFSNALVLIALVALYGFEIYLDRQREKDPKEDKEFKKLRDEIELENMKLTLENLRTEQVRRAEMKAAREEAGVNGARFTF